MVFYNLGTKKVKLKLKLITIIHSYGKSTKRLSEIRDNATYLGKFRAFASLKKLKFRMSLDSLKDY